MVGNIKMMMAGSLLAWASLVIGESELTREELFTAPDFQQCPPKMQVMSEQENDGVKTIEFTFDGGGFNGKPNRIYGYYSRPLAAGKYPGVVQLHGAGLRTLSPNASIFYAKNGFCCISIDWAGEYKGSKKPRQAPFSIVASEGVMAKSIEKGKPLRLIGPEKDRIAEGVRFVRRAFMFLENREEVDQDKLFLSGMSAGAHLSLLILSVETDVKGAAVKYGSSFLQELNPSGYFGPVFMCNGKDKQEWLKYFDPKHGLGNYKTKVLLLSGTNDIFFWMPAVLETYRHLPEGSRLLMLPNDNHSQVGNEKEPLRFYRTVLGLEPVLPTLSSPVCSDRDGALRLQVTTTGDVERVDFWYKLMPKKIFKYKQTKGYRWQSSAATRNGNNWSIELAKVGADEQLVIYATATDKRGAQSSSDTLEIPEYPKWRLAK